MINAVEVLGLSKSYEGFGLQDICLSVPMGVIMGFIGPNGAGKTTTIKCLLGMRRFDNGNVTFFGKPVDKTTHENLGIVTDNTMYEDEWSVAEVEKAVRPFYRKWSKDKFNELLHNFGIDKKKRVKDLSRGMNVKLMIAVALSHDAQLLVLDEPTSGLDPVARDEVCDMLLDFVSDGKRSVIFSTHITSDLEKVADQVTLILGGRIIFSEDVEKLLKKYVLIKGALCSITHEQKEKTIGFRPVKDTFEGMMLAEDAEKFSEDLFISHASLDELIVCMNREEVKN